MCQVYIYRLVCQVCILYICYMLLCAHLLHAAVCSFATCCCVHAAVCSVLCARCFVRDRVVEGIKIDLEALTACDQQFGEMVDMYLQNECVASSEDVNEQQRFESCRQIVQVLHTAHCKLHCATAMACCMLRNCTSWNARAAAAERGSMQQQQLSSSGAAAAEPARAGWGLVVGPSTRLLHTASSAYSSSSEQPPKWSSASGPVVEAVIGPVSAPEWLLGCAHSLSDLCPVSFACFSIEKSSVLLWLCS